MKIALIQLNIEWENQEANYSKVKKLIGEAKKKGAELVCLPELFSTGVTMNASKFAEKLDGKTCAFLSEQAKANKVYLLGSYIQEDGKSLPKNTVIMFDPNGKMVGKYSKNHVFSFGKETESYSNASEISVFKIGDFKIAPFICYDLRFPEVFRLAIDRGVNVFIIPANWPNPRKEHWITLLKARAIENQAYVIGINRAGKSPDSSFFGSSMVLSPKGEVVAKASDEETEQLVIGDIDINKVNEWRRTFGALKDRRQEYYDAQKILASQGKERNWEIWDAEKEYCDYLIKRSKGELPLMECTKQLVKLVKPIYKKGFKILDVCCSAAHYLVGLKQIDDRINYYGVDNTKYLIDAAKEIFKKDNAHISLGDIYNLEFKDREFDIVFCFNTLQNLPDFREPITELLRVTGKYCFIRMLIGENSYFIKQKLEDGKIIYNNIYTFKEISDFVSTLGDFHCELIPDEFNIELKGESDKDTKTINRMQIIGNIVYPWKILKITR